MPADEAHERALAAEHAGELAQPFAHSDVRQHGHRRVVGHLDQAGEIEAEQPGDREHDEHDLVVEREADRSQELAGGRHGDRRREAHHAPAHRQQVVATARSRGPVHHDVECDRPECRRNRDHGPEHERHEHRIGWCGNPHGHGHGRIDELRKPARTCVPRHDVAPALEERGERQRKQEGGEGRQRREQPDLQVRAAEPDDEDRQEHARRVHHAHGERVVPDDPVVVLANRVRRFGRRPAHQVHRSAGCRRDAGSAGTPHRLADRARAGRRRGRIRSACPARAAG